MARGERVARVYIGLVLLAQAVVTGVSGHATHRGLALQVLASIALWVPFCGTVPRVRLRALTILPAVVMSVWWATQSTPLGAAAWVGWAVLVVWLCAPAGLSTTATLAERFHPYTPGDAHP